MSHMWMKCNNELFDAGDARLATETRNAGRETNELMRN